MKHLLLFLTSLCLIATMQAQQTLSNYQYWFDRDYAHAQSGSLSGNTFLSNVPVNTLSNGAHVMNIRFKESNGRWSSVYTQNFSNLSDIITYQYGLTLCTTKHRPEY